tara:strand:+ start:22808 stop:23098 length:291 start_codon:yes stop_codon:yes gene_type:complete
MFFYTQEVEDNDLKDLKPNILSWLDVLIKSNDLSERNRCYYEIRNILHSDTLSGNLQHNHQIINQLIHKYKPKEPAASNVHNNSPYNVSVGFTRKL